MNRFLKHRGVFAVFFILFVAVVSGPHAHAAVIKEYRIFTAELYTQDKRLARIALRKFRMDRKEFYLAVNPDTLQTELVPVGKYLMLKRKLGDIRIKRSNLTYIKTIGYAEQNSRRLQNAGITRIPDGASAVYLTADLCPTKLPMDRVFFKQLITEYGTFHRPVPMGLAVSGVWLEKHPADLKWIIDLDNNNDISVVWINHTYNHRYNKRVPWWRNFLLDKNNHIIEEITRNEITMIESGLLPSVFFRFPGLVSSREIFIKVTDMGLVPVGSDAWLGKKQWPAKGSIILVHANGQEPVGIKRFLWLLNAKKSEIAGGQWILHDLREGIREMMKKY